VPGAHRADLEFAEVGDLGRVPLATYGARSAARMVDFLIVFVPAYFPIAFVAGSFWGRVLLVAVALALYDVIMTARTGATPGKRLARIKIVRAADGKPPGWGRTLVRAVVLGAPGWVIIAVTALFDERLHRGLHDRAAGTVVIAV
jgi:uncharacterized RDD family membrane protein YckC